jgi:cytidine deaminase
MAISNDLIQRLKKEARAARESSYSPYSHFSVGAAALGDNGHIYRGTNVENSSYGLTICAERAAIFSAISHGAKQIAAIALVTSSTEIARPCGACRQVIAEFSMEDEPTLVISESIDGKTAEETISDLFPEAFSL